MKVGVVAQARLSSTRLPGKVLMPMPIGAERSIVEQVARRAALTTGVDVVVVATSDRAQDDAIEITCQRAGIPCYRGDLDDVLSRLHGAAVAHELDTVIRITCDCPCVDAGVIRLMLDRHAACKADLTTNVLPRTFPHGLDVEIASIEALERAHREATSAYDREHVFPFVYRTNPSSFVIEQVCAPAALAHPEIRVTVDTAADYALACGVFDLLGEDFDAQRLVDLFEARPWLKLVNPVT